MATNSREHFGLESFDSKMLSVLFLERRLRGGVHPFFKSIVMFPKSFFFSTLFFLVSFFSVTGQTFTPEMDDTSDTSKITTTIIYYNVAWIDSLGVEHVDWPSAESTDYWAVKSMLDIYQKSDPKNYYFVKIRLKEIGKKE